jgi:hypothetical protein
MSANSDFVLLGGRLRCRAKQFSDVSLDAATTDGARLLLVVDREVISDDPILHYCFAMLGERGHMLLVEPDNGAELVAELPSGIEVARGWLDAGLPVNVVVAEPVSVALVAAAVLIACGASAPSAVNEVFAALDEVPSAHEEVFCAVFAEKLIAYRAWHEARRLQYREVLQ